MHQGALAEAPAERMRALVSAGADAAAVNTAGEMPIDLVPDDSALWSVLIPLKTPESGEASVPGPVRNLRVTEFTERPDPELNYRRRTYDWTWKRPASDGGSPITEYQYASMACRFRSPGGVKVFPMTRARAGQRSFTHTHSENHYSPAWKLFGRPVSLWAVNAKGPGPCVDVAVVAGQQ